MHDVVAFAVSGLLIFKFLSITIGAFHIAGGIILFSVALGMLHAQAARMMHTPKELAEAMSGEVAVKQRQRVLGAGAGLGVAFLAGRIALLDHLDDLRVVEGSRGSRRRRPSGQAPAKMSTISC